jgi:hypothetical protein
LGHSLSYANPVGCGKAFPEWLHLFEAHVVFQGLDLLTINNILKYQLFNMLHGKETTPKTK